MVSIGTEEIVPSGEAITDSRRALVGRVIGSSVFAKSERLSSFLSCVCELTLSGRANEINEQKIGIAVFGRSPDYDSSIDGIVRTQASRLRQRLDLYFSGEGSSEPIRIVLPRGTYVPVFEPQAPDVTVSAPSQNPVLNSPVLLPERPAETISDGRGSKLAWALVAILSIALPAVLLRSKISPSREATAPVANHPFWSLLFRPDQRTTLVPADSGLVIWQGIMKKNISLAEYVSGSYRIKPSGEKLPPTGDAFELGNRRYTSIVDLDIVRSLSHIADMRRSIVELRYARDARPNDLKEGDAVLIGAAEANPWVELFEPNMNFAFSNDRIRNIYSVLNRKPAEGEPAQWDSEYKDVQHRVYGVVAFLPNLNGKGNVLILEGTSMAGTECAWDFVADDSTLLPFLDRIRRPDGTIPHFQLVLGTNNVSGSSVKSSILAWRVTK